MCGAADGPRLRHPVPRAGTLHALPGVQREALLRLERAAHGQLHALERRARQLRDRADRRRRGERSRALPGAGRLPADPVRACARGTRARHRRARARAHRLAVPRLLQVPDRRDQLPGGAGAAAVPAVAVPPLRPAHGLAAARLRVTLRSAACRVAPAARRQPRDAEHVAARRDRLGRLRDPAAADASHLRARRVPHVPAHAARPHRRSEAGGRERGAGARGAAGERRVYARAIRAAARRAGARVAVVAREHFRACGHGPQLPSTRTAVLRQHCFPNMSSLCHYSRVSSNP